MLLTLHRRQSLFLGLLPPVLVVLLVLSSPPTGECGTVDRRRPGSNGGPGERRRGGLDRLPPCPSDACRCRWTKASLSSGGRSSSPVARCSPSADRPSLPEMFDEQPIGSRNTTNDVIYAELHIRRANLTELPTDGFRRVATRLLDLTGNRFTQPTSVSPDAFAGMESVLEILMLTDCGMTAVPSAALSRLAALRVLRLDGNEIVALTAGVFSFGSTLRELYVYRNSIDRVDPFAFDGLTALEKLSLADNQIASLSPGTLSRLANLTSLDVARNRLTALDDGWLDGLASLQWLEIESNRITSIHVGTFRGASSLRYMRAENNALTSVDDDAFRPIGGLNYLSIDLSNVSRLTSRTLAGLGRLKTLNLGELRRSALPSRFFSPLRRLKYLSLTDNDGYLPPDDVIREDVFGTKFRFRHLNVWMAPIRDCRCSATWIRRLSALGTYVHGFCFANQPLSCTAVGKSAASAGGKHPNNRRYKSGQ